MIQHYDIKTTDDIKDAELDIHLGYDKNSKETKGSVAKLIKEV
ncbi:hypothetical protein [Enterococcus sp. DIV0086]